MSTLTSTEFTLQQSGFPREMNAGAGVRGGCGKFLPTCLWAQPADMWAVLHREQRRGLRAPWAHENWEWSCVNTSAACQPSGSGTAGDPPDLDTWGRPRVEGFCYTVTLVPDGTSPCAAVCIGLPSSVQQRRRASKVHVGRS